MIADTASEEAGHELLFSEVGFAYPGTVGEAMVLNGLSLSVSKNEIVGVFGPNGCGKSTILNLIAGLSPLGSGHIFWRGRSDALPKPGFVFQAYAQSLMPWLSCIDNIALPLIPSVSGSLDRRQAAFDFCGRLGLTLPFERRPGHLSGGQKQLASVARALISEPEILLLDEPLASLDYINKLMVLDNLQNLWMTNPVSTILVTHDIEDAFFLCDRVYVLSSRPARVIDEIVVPMARPRTIQQTSSVEIGLLRDRVLSHFGQVTT